MIFNYYMMFVYNKIFCMCNYFVFEINYYYKMFFNKMFFNCGEQLSFFVGFKFLFKLFYYVFL